MNAELDHMQEAEQLSREKSVVMMSSIPMDLRGYPQWVCWRYVDRGPDKKPDKRPINPHNLHNAGVQWPNSWSTFEEAFAMYEMHRGTSLNGIGFVLTARDPFVGIDIDHCIGGAGILPDAQDMIRQFHSYTEISPSGAGLRILVASPGFARNMRRQGLEVYSHSRFVTLTGHHVAGTPSSITTRAADQIAALLPAAPRAVPPAAAVEPEVDMAAMSGVDLWERIFQYDRFGHQHRRRFGGDTSLDGNDHSLSVIRLVNCLVRWTGGDAARMRTLMLMSPLANEKWHTKRGDRDWLDLQIADAIAFVSHRG